MVVSDNDKPKRGDDVRGSVMQAALECFGAFGFEGTSTRAVAERAGVGHSLIIYHFDSKEQLWSSTMDHVIGNYVDLLCEQLAQCDKEKPEEALRLFIEQFVRLSAETPQVHRILTMESNQGTERMNALIDAHLIRLFTRVRDIIRYGQDKGTIRDGDPARLYYHIIATAGTPFTIWHEYKILTHRDVFSEAEILRNIAFIYETVFV